MKKFITFLILLSFLFGCSCYGADTVTTYYKLICPEEGSYNWTEKISNDLTSIDSILNIISLDVVAISNDVVGTLKPLQTVTVAKGGADYTTIQDAIDSIADASITKKYAILVYPGVYNENVVGKNYVSLKGMGTTDATIISKDSGILYDFPDKGGNIRNIKFSGVPTASGMTLISIDSGGHIVKNLTLRMESSTNNITGTHISLAGGSLDISVCDCWYLMHGTNAGSLIHSIINIPGGNSSLAMKNVVYDIDIADADDVAIFVNEATAAAGGESIIQGNSVHMNLSNVAFSGAAGMYYAHGAQTNKSVLSNHFHLKTPGNGIGYIVYMDTAANNGKIRSSGNQIIVEGFANNYLANLGAGDRLFTHCDDVSADTGTTGAGTLTYASSFVDGEFSCTGAITADNVSTDVIRFDSVVASPDVANGAPLLCVSEDPAGTMRLLFYNGSTWELISYG